MPDPMTLGERLFRCVIADVEWDTLYDSAKNDWVRGACDLYNLGRHDALLPLRKAVGDAMMIDLAGPIVVSEDVSDGS